MLRLRQRLFRSARANRPLGKPAKRDHPVIHDERACHGDIDADVNGNFDDELAARHHFRRKRSAFRSQHIGGAKRVTKAWQLHRIFRQLVLIDEANLTRRAAVLAKLEEHGFESIDFQLGPSLD